MHWFFHIMHKHYSILYEVVKKTPKLHARIFLKCKSVRTILQISQEQNDSDSFPICLTIQHKIVLLTLSCLLTAHRISKKNTSPPQPFH